MSFTVSAKPLMVTRVASKSTTSRVSMKKAPVMAMKLEEFGKAALAFTTSLALAASANAASVKLGSDTGGLVFEPSTLTVSSGEKITWTNNAGFPHNVVFDEDEVPDGVDADALSHSDLLNGPGDSVSSTL